MANAGAARDAARPHLPIAAVRVGIAALALLGLYGFGWLSVAPNRLLPGQPLPATAALGPATHLAALAIAIAATIGAAPAGRSSRLLPPVFLFGALALLLATTGLAATRLLEGRPASARAMLGVLLLELLRGAPGALRWLVAAAAMGAAVFAGRLGLFDAVSLVVEYHARADLVQTAAQRHLALASAALGFALLLAVPLGLWALHSSRAEAAIGAALDTAQVVPAIAMFGLLVPALALLLDALPQLRAAGLGAIGAAPALIGITAYLALPLWRALLAGLTAPDPAILEAARAMGMSEPRIVTAVRLPLALPIFAAGLRVAAVQAVGLVTLGGLVGAGGLGALVFEGMAQFAADLILLGALPIVALALVADTALRALEVRLAEMLHQ